MFLCGGEPVDYLAWGWPWLWRLQEMFLWLLPKAADGLDPKTVGRFAVAGWETKSERKPGALLIHRQNSPLWRSGQGGFGWWRRCRNACFRKKVFSSLRFSLLSFAWLSEGVGVWGRILTFAQCQSPVSCGGAGSAGLGSTGCFLLCCLSTGTPALLHGAWQVRDVAWPKKVGEREVIHGSCLQIFSMTSIPAISDTMMGQTLGSAVILHPL